MPYHATTFLYYFNPRPPHGERPIHDASGVPSGFRISIHAPPHGERPTDETGNSKAQGFQSTPPARGTTSVFDQKMSEMYISIHAPRTGSDVLEERIGELKQNFNPRPPHGERRNCCNPSRLINPRPPHGERQGMMVTFKDGNKISIHAPRTGSDGQKSCCNHVKVRISIPAPRTGSDLGKGSRSGRREYFNPRPPHGERQGMMVTFKDGNNAISIHAPRTGSDGRKVR